MLEKAINEILEGTSTESVVESLLHEIARPEWVKGEWSADDAFEDFTRIANLPKTDKIKIAVEHFLDLLVKERQKYGDTAPPEVEQLAKVAHLLHTFLARGVALPPVPHSKIVAKVLYKEIEKRSQGKKMMSIKSVLQRHGFALFLD